MTTRLNLSGAACAGDDFELYTDETDPESIAETKAICHACPVRNNCLTEALARDEPWGIWGGLTTKERRHLRSKEKTAA